MRSLLVLDQWASKNISIGTYKGWLYDKLTSSFSVTVLNANNGLFHKYRMLQCFLAAVVSSGINCRKSYHDHIEWKIKRPNSFRSLTRRFQSSINSLNKKFDAVLQIGCLFGPTQLQGALKISYHDQTVAMVVKEWGQWLPPDFHKYQDEFFDLERNALNATDLILTYSEYTRRSIIDDYCIPEERVMVAPSACKIVFPHKNEVLKTRYKALLFASTDFYRKGGDIVLQAFKTLRRHHPQLELILVGGSIPVPLPDGAKYLGMLPPKELIRQYLDCSIILHPARHDPFPNVLKEAQVCGLPAITSSSCGIPEIICHGRTGLILPKPDAAALSNAVLELMGKPEWLEAMRLACLQDRDRFRPEICSGRIASAITSALDKQNPRKVVC